MQEWAASDEREWWVGKKKEVHCRQGKWMRALRNCCDGCDDVEKGVIRCIMCPASEVFRLPAALCQTINFGFGCDADCIVQEIA